MAGNGCSRDAPTRISVIIPCHNYGAFLRESVASLEAQTRPADEVVLVDDGSTDDTTLIMEEIAQKDPRRWRAFARSPARGAVETFNDGIRWSTGDLVMLLSADDRLSPRYLELMESALEDPEISFAYASERMFGSESRWRAAPPFDERELMRENPFNGSGMFRRSLFDLIGGFRPDFAELGLEDWEFWVHCVEAGARGTLVDGCWLEYRRHPAGSRNTLTRLHVLRAHLKVWWLHRGTVRLRDQMVWMGRSARRTLRRVLRTSS